MTRKEEIDKAGLEWFSQIKKYDADVAEAFMAGAKWADANPRWISVDEELPPRWETNPNVSVPVITFGTIGESIPFVELQRYDFGGSKWQYSDATHWMPFQFPKTPSCSEFPNNHIIDVNKKVDRVIGTPEHIQTALDVLNKKGGEE